MSRHRLYHDLAELWPLLSPPEDYAPEAATLRRVIAEHMEPRSQGRAALLEFGAGGGHTLRHLRDEFDCVAVDYSEAMLANCRKLNPDVQAIVGDMRTLRLDRSFDVVLIHDAIDYMLSEADVRAALDTAAAHLRRGGVALIAPTYTRETFENHQADQDQNRSGDRVLTYFQYVHDADPLDTTFELILVYLINDAGQVRIEHDRHTCGLFAERTWLTLMNDAGFDARANKPLEGDPDWILYVAIRR